MANKNQLLRYMIIDRIIRNHHYPSKKYILQKINEELDQDHSDSVLEKDLYAMRHDFQAPIEFHNRERGYFYGTKEQNKRGVMCYEKIDNYSFVTIDLPQKNVLMLNMAVSVLESFKNIGLLEGFAEAVDKVLDVAHIGQELNNGTQKLGIVQLDTPTYVKGRDFLSPLVHAIQQSKQVSFDYQKFADDDVSKRRVHPYLLKEFDGRWYMICFEEKSNMIKNFGLDRMSNIKTLEQNTIPPQEHDFDPKNYFQNCYGISKKEKEVYHIVLSFSPYIANYIRTQPLHETQKEILDNEDEYRISLDLIINPELISLLLKYGRDLKVISPPILVDKIQKELQMSIANYQ